MMIDVGVGCQMKIYLPACRRFRQAGQGRRQFDCGGGREGGQMMGGLTSLDDFDDDIKSVTIRFIMTEWNDFERERRSWVSSEDVLLFVFSWPWMLGG